MSLLAWLTLAAAVFPQSEPFDAAAAVTRMVDAPTAAERGELARQLAARSDVSLAQWLAAVRALPLRTDEPVAVLGRNRRYVVAMSIFGGMRNAEIHVRLPTDAATRRGPWPLLFVWHAAGSDGAAALAAWSGFADRFGFLLAAPTETYDGYQREGWSYHPDGYEGLFAALRFVRRNFDVDEDRIVLAGVRGGGHATWDVGLRFPDRFAALIPANGAPRLGNALRECNLAFVESAWQLPIRIVRWGAVESLQDANLRRAVELLRGFGSTDVSQLEAANEAEALSGSASGWAEFVAQRRRVPDRVVRYADQAWMPPLADWGRLHWLEIVRTDAVAIDWPPKVTAPRGKLDAQAVRNAIDAHVRDHLPRLQVHRQRPGRFEVQDRAIAAFRLLVTDAMLGPDGSLVATWRGHTLTKTAAPSARVLLAEFAERFDRTFLPTAEVRFP